MTNMSICLISFVCLMFMSILCFFFGMTFIMEDYSIFIEWEVISLNSMNIVMTLLLDWMSLIFMSFVLTISSLVIFYSKEYMESDYKINRFILLVLMFVTSMMLLIISPNLISILLGWDGLGLVSYCLVIYFQNVKSYNAGMLTALSNRIGDVALLLAIAWMLNYGSWNYIFYLEVMNENFEMMLVGSLVMLAAMTKSAQILCRSTVCTTAVASINLSLTNGNGVYKFAVIDYPFSILFEFKTLKSFNVELKFLSYNDVAANKVCSNQNARC